MEHKVLYRAYRPSTFEEVVGQKVIVQTLRNAVKHNMISHAYIFAGPRGTGKTSIAKIFSKAVNCLHNNAGSPCDVCPNCKSIKDNECLDIVELDAASNNSVKDIRSLIGAVDYLPTSLKYKVYIIDEVHMLTNEAFNALLKTLEEPPAHVIFILATTEIHQLPATIISRCQRFDFKNIEVDSIAKQISNICKKENIEIEPDAAFEIAKVAEGGMRDAISLLDQIMSYTDGKITSADVYDVSGSISKENIKALLLALIKNDLTTTLSICDSLINNGKDVSKIVSDIVMAIRDVLIESISGKKSYYAEVYANTKVEKFYYYLDVLSELNKDLKSTTLKRPLLELALIKMVQHSDSKVIDFVSIVEDLKKEVNDLKLVKPTTSVSPKAAENKRFGMADIVKVLYNADKEKKELLVNAHKNTTIKELMYFTVEAVSSEAVIISAPTANNIKNISVKSLNEAIIQYFNNSINTIKMVYPLTKNTWDEIRKEYKKQHDDNVKKPIISGISFEVYDLVDDKPKPKTIKPIENVLEGMTTKDIIMEE